MIKLCGPVGALTVVDVLHVAGVLVWSQMQSDSVSCVRLQMFWSNLKTKTKSRLYYTLVIQFTASKD